MMVPDRRANWLDFLAWTVRVKKPTYNARLCMTICLLFASLIDCHLAYALDSEQEGLLAQSAGTDEKVVTSIRGEKAIVEKIILGPRATEFWMHIQDLIARGRLADFSAISLLLGFKPIHSDSDVSLDKPGVQQRTDISDGHFVESGRYGIFQDPATKSGRMISLQLNLALGHICISDQEIHRVYGKGSVGKQFDNLFARTPGAQDSPAGFKYLLGFSNNTNGITFTATIAESGCAISLSLKSNTD